MAIATTTKPGAAAAAATTIVIQYFISIVALYVRVQNGIKLITSQAFCCDIEYADVIACSMRIIINPT